MVGQHRLWRHSSAHTPCSQSILVMVFLSGAAGHDLMGLVAIHLVRPWARDRILAPTAQDGAVYFLLRSWHVNGLGGSLNYP